MSIITDVYAREVLRPSRGNPTLEVEVILNQVLMDVRWFHQELLLVNTKQLNFVTDKSPWWSWYSKVVDNVNNIIAEVNHRLWRDQQAIDRAMIAFLTVLLTKVNWEQTQSLVCLSL